MLIFRAYLLPTQPVQVNSKILDELDILMTVDRKFPHKNQGLAVAIALDVLMDTWKEVRKKDNNTSFMNYYHETMKRIRKLQKDKMVDEKVRFLRTEEEIKDAK